MRIVGVNIYCIALAVTRRHDIKFTIKNIYVFNIQPKRHIFRKANVSSKHFISSILSFIQAYKNKVVSRTKSIRKRIFAKFDLK